MTDRANSPGSDHNPSDHDPSDHDPSDHDPSDTDGIRLRRPWRFGLPSMVLAGLILAAVIGTVVTGRNEGGGSTGAGVALVLLLALLAWAVFHLAVAIAAMFRAEDPDAGRIAARLGRRDEQRYLIERWLRRSRWYRNVGGCTGVIAGFVAAGPGGLILLGLIGMTAGSMLAELHLLGAERRPVGHRTADLTPRSLTTYWNPRHQLGMAAVTGLAVALLVADRLDAINADFKPGWAWAAVAVSAAAWIIQWRVATRSRPALPTPLRGADNLIRRLAITQGIANPALSLGVALLGQSVWDSHQGWSVVAWLAALALFWGGRRLGLDWLLQQPPLEPDDGPRSPGPRPPAPGSPGPHSPTTGGPPTSMTVGPAGPGPAS